MSEQRDIIERLRDRTGYWHSMLRDEAADEIASLRARLAQSEANHGQAVSYLQDQLASARKALEEIVQIYTSAPGMACPEPSAGAMWMIWHAAHLALTDEEGKS